MEEDDELRGVNYPCCSTSRTDMEEKAPITFSEQNSIAAMEFLRLPNGDLHTSEHNTREAPVMSSETTNETHDMDVENLDLYGTKSEIGGADEVNETDTCQGAALEMPEVWQEALEISEYMGSTREAPEAAYNIDLIGKEEVSDMGQEFAEEERDFDKGGQKDELALKQKLLAQPQLEQDDIDTYQGVIAGGLDLIEEAHMEDYNVVAGYESVETGLKVVDDAVCITERSSVEVPEEVLVAEQIQVEIRDTEEVKVSEEGLDMGQGRHQRRYIEELKDAWEGLDKVEVGVGKVGNSGGKMMDNQLLMDANEEVQMEGYMMESGNNLEETKSEIVASAVDIGERQELNDEVKLSEGSDMGQDRHWRRDTEELDDALEGLDEIMANVGEGAKCGRDVMDNQFLIAANEEIQMQGYKMEAENNLIDIRSEVVEAVVDNMVKQDDEEVVEAVVDNMVKQDDEVGNVLKLSEDAGDDVMKMDSQSLIVANEEVQMEGFEKESGNNFIEKISETVAAAVDIGERQEINNVVMLSDVSNMGQDMHRSSNTEELEDASQGLDTMTMYAEDMAKSGRKMIDNEPLVVADEEVQMKGYRMEAGSNLVYIRREIVEAAVGIVEKQVDNVVEVLEEGTDMGQDSPQGRENEKLDDTWQGLGKFSMEMGEVAKSGREMMHNQTLAVADEEVQMEDGKMEDDKLEVGGDLIGIRSESVGDAIDIVEKQEINNVVLTEDGLDDVGQGRYQRRDTEILEDAWQETDKVAIDAGDVVESGRKMIENKLFVDSVNDVPEVEEVGHGEKMTDYSISETQQEIHEANQDVFNSGQLVSEIASEILEVQHEKMEERQGAVGADNVAVGEWPIVSVIGTEILETGMMDANAGMDTAEVVGAVSDNAVVESGVEEVGAEVLERGGINKSKRARNSKAPMKVPTKKITEEDVCFICFDGGDLVLCDRRGCPKAYHPACVNRDEAFFRAKGRWNCGWHLCSVCQKNAYYMCYTCTYSLCKGCIRDASILCVRGNKGFCDACMKTVMLIEQYQMSGGEMVQVDFNDRSSWEYLFKDYYTDLKNSLNLTHDEVANSKHPLKGLDLLGSKEHPEVYDNEDGGNSDSESASEHLESRRPKKRRSKKPSTSPKTGDSPRGKGAEHVAMTGSAEWASKELLELVMHMRNGDISELSQFDVQALLLEYIKQNKLRDPRRKSQILCDQRLQSIFGKARVGHFEMLKLLESHFLLKVSSLGDDGRNNVFNTEAAELDDDGNVDTSLKTGKAKKRKLHRKGDARVLQSNLDDFAAIDMHNISLIYLPRNLMEDLLEDIEHFHEKVVGSFVRLRLGGNAQKQDIYRLVQVVGTSKAEKPYKVGKRTTDITLEILNLNRTEIISIDILSNHEFMEEECKRLRQSMKFGIISRLTVGEILEKAMTLHAARVNDMIEKEIVRLGHLCDRASEMDRRKELRECVEKLQLLKTAEERQRRLEEVPQVHADPNMDPSHESEDEVENDRSQGSFVRARDGGFSQRARDPVCPGSSGQNSQWNSSRRGTNNKWELSRNSSMKSYSSREEKPGATFQVASQNLKLEKDRAPLQPNALKASPVGHWDGQVSLQTESTSTAGSGLSPTQTAPRGSETDKVWRYQDPSGKVQGPFSLVQLKKWSNTGYFPTDLRIWRTNEKQEDSVLLALILKDQTGVNADPLKSHQAPNTVSTLPCGMPSPRVSDVHSGSSRQTTGYWKPQQSTTSGESQTVPNFIHGVFSGTGSCTIPNGAPLIQPLGQNQIQDTDTRNSVVTQSNFSIQPSLSQNQAGHYGPGPVVGVLPAPPGPPGPHGPPGLPGPTPVPLSNLGGPTQNPEHGNAVQIPTAQAVYPNWGAPPAHVPVQVFSNMPPAPQYQQGFNPIPPSEPWRPPPPPPGPPPHQENPNQNWVPVGGNPGMGWVMPGPTAMNLNWGMPAPPMAPVNANPGFMPQNVNWGMAPGGLSPALPPEGANLNWGMAPQGLPPGGPPENATANWGGVGQGPPQPAGTNSNWVGNANQNWGNSGGWGGNAEQKNPGGVPGGGGGESGYGAGRQWKQQGYGGNKGQKVCVFYENGRCNRGTSCSYIHNTKESR